ncbi:Uncharacterized protein OBRU01_21626, partial [Operophtera brumata]
MYIYELPFDINRELCRLLDMDDTWKELAGEQMKYSSFHIIEIEQIAKRQSNSPTHQLFTRWGQLNHNVGELFILLYHMKHVPALRCLNSTQSKDAKSKSADDEIAKNVSSIPKISEWVFLPVAVKKLKDNDKLNQELIREMCEWVFLPVAVKKLKDNDKLNQELIREMCPEACLVYQLMTGGSLQQRIHREKGKYPPLTWPQRYRIAHGVARGLQYLHNMDGSTPLIHGDIKPANILLDQCLMPKIGDFGLARKVRYGDDKTHLKVSKRHYMEGALLIHGDIKPANILLDQCLMPKIGDFGLARKVRYGDDKTHLKVSKRYSVLSRALDTYSYGVVALEMATGRPPARKRPDAE